MADQLPACPTCGGRVTPVITAPRVPVRWRCQACSVGGEVAYVEPIGGKADAVPINPLELRVPRHPTYTSEFPWKLTIGSVFVFITLFTIGLMAGCPQYNAWRRTVDAKANVTRQTLQGEAELKRAEQNRRIAVLEAQATLDGAKLKAQAEVERAKGVAEANKIIADGLGGHDGYLRYLWIDRVAAQAGKEIIYVPTEASLPILESTRLLKGPGLVAAPPEKAP